MIDDCFTALAEPGRIRTIAEYQICDPGLRERLDARCRRTADLLGTPTAAVTVVLDSALVLIGSYGLTGLLAAVGGSPVEWAFCGYALLGGEATYVVPDAGAHPVHATSPLVLRDGVRAYAGVPVCGHDGQVLGMHCVTAGSPTRFGREHLDLLRTAATEVSEILDEYRISDSVPV